jgi:nucleoid-associated protein YgaU
MAAGTLEKAKIKWTTRMVIKGEIECQFNPSQLKIKKKTSWSSQVLPQYNSPKLTFDGGEAATYDLTLYFDAYSGKPTDVRFYTNQLLRLTMRDYGYSMFKIPKAEPPTVTFVWGKISMFSAKVNEVEIKYTMFAPDGTPIRAVADVSFIQQQTLLGDDLIPPQNPTSRSEPRKTRLVHSMQRLDQIAYEEYGDARMWRRIAEANGMDDPFSLRDGQILVIPQD